MAENLLEELKSYVGWSAADEQALRTLHARAEPRFESIAEAFYDVILSNEGARRSLLDGESKVGQLKVTLRAWMDRLLRGPWDEAYFQARCRIGRVHVRIGLPQHYMFGAMNVVRRHLEDAAGGAFEPDPAALAAVHRALGKILDLELAIMLHTYREDLLAQQARAERLATFGQLVGSIGHDLRNPLGVIETSAFILRGRLGDDEKARKHLDRIGDQLGVANGIITNLIDMIRDRPLLPRSVALRDVVGGAADSLTRPEQVDLLVEGLDQLPEVRGDPVQLRQVFTNLLDNAFCAASPTGEVRIRGAAVAGAVVVSVEDSGPGVDPAIRRRLFEPLITTKDQGIGLGLALVKRIIERHGGAVGYEDRAGGGARFTIHIPS